MPERSSSSIERRPRMRAPERRQQFLDVAAKLVLDRGPDAITMERVCELAEVNRALIYRFFANRDELLVQLVERESQHLDEAVNAALADTTTFEEETRAIISTYLDLELRNQMVVSRRVGSMSTPPGLLLEWQRARNESTVRFLAEIQRRYRPELSGHDALVLAASLGSAVTGVLALAEAGLETSRLVDTFVHVCIGASDRVSEGGRTRQKARRTATGARVSKRAPATKQKPAPRGR